MSEITKQKNYKKYVEVIQMKNANIVIELNEEYAAKYGQVKGNEKAKESKVVPFPTAAADQIEVVDTETLTDPSNVAQRDEYITRVDVLTKVGDLLLLGGTEFATTKQIADYYETGIEAIKSIIKRHRSELDTDGMVLYKRKDLDAVICRVQDEPNINFGISSKTPQALLCPKRAVLRIGMLLRDSEVAKSVRDQLLNIEETATNEQRTAAIDREGELMLAVMRAVDQVEQLKAIAELNKFKDARIEEARAAAAKYEDKANKFEYVTDQAGVLTMTNVGKSYLGGVSAQELNRFLIDRGILYKNRRDGVRLYRKGYEKYFKVVTYDAGYRTLKVTLDGALFIADLYRKEHTAKKI